MEQKESIIARGAEAVIVKQGSKIIKNRIAKSYRHPELDEKLRKSRTKKEAKLIEKSSSLIPVPKLLNYHNKNENTNQFSHSTNYLLSIEFIKGKKLSEHLEKLDYISICKQIGKNIAKLHDAGIIHGDLTTSNMILAKPNSKKSSSSFTSNTQQNLSINNPTNFRSRSKQRTIPEENKVYFIDFGLGFHSNRIEDKAVDLHLIKQALEAKHHSIYEKAFKSILNGYKLSKNYAQVLKQLEKVEKRGRYKMQY